MVEGKRTEGLSVSTDWYPSRNQLLRNLETAAEIAADREFAVLLAVEKVDGILPDRKTIDAGLPHLSSSAREHLLDHLLGPVTWARLCESTSVPLNVLPDTTEAFVATRDVS